MVHFRHAWVLLFATAIVTILPAISYIPFGEPLDPVNIRNLEETSRLSAPLGDWVRNWIRYLGVSWLALGVLTAAVSAKAYRRGEMWAWYASWITPVFIVGTMIIAFTIGETSWPFFLVLLVVSLIGLLLAPQFESITRHEKKSS